MRCKQNRAERFLHNCPPGPQCPCFWLSLQSQVSATCLYATHLLPAALGSLLWFSAAAPHCLHHPLPLQAGSFPFHSSPSSRKTIQLILLRGLQYEFKQLWSHPASPLISLNLNSPFQTRRRKAPGCGEGLGRGGGRGGWNPSTEAVWMWERESMGKGGTEEENHSCI